ncbi:tetrahydrofolate dehydrogenase/cyclohydrolase, NAD(P)-binding domain protein [Medicago truncatula]|uniref:Tetrahydrofolate dehydrogenase/cyclohydrolase, NAD(P)-binding domain protein n=1 Tax=Medicago truncatula TaxID=3880 RepID=G7IVA9_MEDTR|nr:tetrahydrofolate dehydrogenase/cyclohydrolase, NAD(P)-binding domain protein [Medicago truncatula]
MSTQGSNVAIITVTEREQSINIFLCGQTFSNVVTDVGIPYIVRGDSIKKGAVVIDMGTNQVKNLVLFSDDLSNIYSKLKRHKLKEVSFKEEIVNSTH